MSDTQTLSARLPAAVMDALRDRARAEDRTVSYIARRALLAHLGSNASASTSRPSAGQANVGG